MLVMPACLKPFIDSVSSIIFTYSKREFLT